MCLIGKPPSTWLPCGTATIYITARNLHSPSTVKLKEEQEQMAN